MKNKKHSQPGTYSKRINGVKHFYTVMPEPYSKLCQTFKIEHFGKIANDFQLLNISAKKLMFDKVLNTSQDYLSLIFSKVSLVK